jgi:subtilisin family serine protease/subtilisin-like proprotein convertase family protein
MKGWARLLLLPGVVSWMVQLRSALNAEELRFEFRTPGLATYRVDLSKGASLASEAAPAWLKAWPATGSGPAIELGSRVVLQTQAPERLPGLLADSPLRVDRTVGPGLVILQAPDALTAAREAHRLAAKPGVEVSHPVRRRPAKLHGGYAPEPNDPYFNGQWHLEHRSPDTGARLGPDLNVRAAWPHSQGQGVVIAIGDDGFEVNHPDLSAHSSSTNHFNFVTGLASGLPLSSQQGHGTAVAGLAAAVGGNKRGVSGVAPAAKLASWVIFDSVDNLVDEEKLMDMFQYRSNVVGVQNHSWGNSGVEQLTVGVLEDRAIGQAVKHGRGGKGVVIVRSAGNERTAGNDVNDDAYAQDPRVITVGAVRQNGQAASYSTPGACVLVAAPSGDNQVDLPGGGSTNYPGLLTTDRQGSLGYYASADADRGDYTFGASGFTGTSGSAPQVAGLCALLLGAKPSLTYRDVQQVLLLSARQLHLADPDLQTNGAGLLVSYTTGFGVPDAGEALRLARLWPNRPAVSTVSVTNKTAADIPDDGLRVIVTGTRVPLDVQSIPAFPFDGLHPDDPTQAVPLVDVGQALEPLTTNLTGKAALIQRGQNFFVEKLQRAAAAGAVFAVVYNNVNGDERIFMNGADIQFSPIPAVFIAQYAGERLRDYVAQNPDARGQLRLSSVRFALQVTNALLCEQVALRVQFSHSRRADVRLTLVSPAGTRSVLHHFNQDLNSALGWWTFCSARHFYESSHGTWTVEVSDERPAMLGRVLSMALTIHGVPIGDADNDGLDDQWETACFGSLAFGPRDDNDRDGYNNMREMLAGTDPLAAATPFRADVCPWNAKLARVSWPATLDFDYEVFAGADLTQPLTAITSLAGAFPEAEWFARRTNLSQQFFRILSRPRP